MTVFYEPQNIISPRNTFEIPENTDDPEVQMFTNTAKRNILLYSFPENSISRRWSNAYAATIILIYTWRSYRVNITAILSA